MTNLEQVLFRFLKRNLDSKKPVLIGLSGGPDSLTLLHLLLEYRKQFPIELGIAHIDHGWRKESGSEAKQLKSLANELGIPFHLKVISPDDLSGNLEAACRDERLKFFSELCLQNGYQAVLLGHHADDQAETVLKRVLEGADLQNLSGLQEVKHIDRLTLWRPFLAVSKTAIQSWLADREIQAFEDYTNNDPRFLRGKFRTEIIPALSQAFGKQISSSLCHIAHEAQELKEYLKNTLGHYLKRVERGHLGIYLDLTEDCPSSPYAVKYIISELCREEGIFLTRSLLDTACELLMAGKGDRQMSMGGFNLYIDRKRLFLVREGLEILPEATKLQVGTFDYGRWKVTVMPIEKKDGMKNVGWKGVWSGHVEAILPARQYLLGPGRMSAPYPGQSAISRWWTDAKVPAFLRHCVPVVWEGDAIRHEFLTHRNKPEDSTTAGNWIRIVLQAHLQGSCESPCSKGTK